MNYYIYAYCNQYKSSMIIDQIVFPGEPFYIGYGKNSRMFAHLKEARSVIAGGPVRGNKHKIYSIVSLLTMGITPEIVIVRDGLSKDEACKLETDLIRRIGKRIDGSGPLTNIARGGTGGDTLSNHPLNKTGMLNFDRRGNKNPMFGKTGAGNPNTKQYEFTLQHGEKHIVYGGDEFAKMVSFCRMSRSAAFDVIKGRKENHKGIRIKVLHQK